MTVLTYQKIPRTLWLLYVEVLGTVSFVLEVSLVLASPEKYRNYNTVKTCLKQPLEKKTKIGFQDLLSLNAGKKYCRMLSWSILQYFRPSLSYNLSLRPLFCLFLSGCLRQVLLYQNFTYSVHMLLYRLVLTERITIFKIFICGGISSDIRLVIQFYGVARAMP